MAENILNVTLRVYYKKIFLFVKRQTRQIKEEGFSVIFQKIRKVLVKWFFIIIALPIVLILRLLQPLIFIRFIRLDAARIGGVLHADWYLSGCSSKISGKRYLDFFYYTRMSDVICNYFWLKMWNRILNVFPFWKFAEVINNISKKIPGHRFQSVPINIVTPIVLVDQKKYLQHILNQKTPHISFTKEEEEFGENALSDIGILKGTPFICFHSRDSAYLDFVYPQRNWSYHDYRDSDINNYVPAVESIVQKGYYGVRVGSAVKDKISINNPAIIDYPFSGKRTEFLDVYLGAKCEFFIYSDTGIATIPEMFRRPGVYVNWAPISRISPWVLNGLFIFKKFYSVREKRFLNFREVINTMLGNCSIVEELRENEIELKENTPEEIKAVVVEMYERLNGIWETTPEEEALQQCFWELFGPKKLKSPDLRIGTEFLRQNIDLLK